MTYDLVVVGAGPGGYTGAIRAAQLGLKVAVVEKDKNLGGTCLNVGCIPSKALLDSSEHYHFAQVELHKHGVRCPSVSLDLKTMMKRKSKIVSDLTQGIAYLLKKNKIERFEGTGSLLSPGEVQVTKEQGESPRVLKARHVMLATGSLPNELPGVKWDGDQVISSTEALSLTRVPKSLLVIGGGYIGLEMGSVWSRLGSKVKVLEYADRLCPAVDKAVSKSLLKSLKQQGLEFVLESAVQGVGKKGASSVEVTYKDKAGEVHQVSAEKVLLAVGRRPCTGALGLKKLGISTDRQGFVEVDHQFRTVACPSVFAIGDVIGGAMLAHKAEEEGVAVAEIIAGHPGAVHYDTLPSVIYTWPEVASVGKTEEQLKAQGASYRVGQFPFKANGRAKALDATEGFVKVLADKVTDRLLGVHILGPRASDMIAEAVVAMEFEGTSEDLALSFHAHPTLSEVVREAALAVDGRSRQI